MMNKAYNIAQQSLLDQVEYYTPDEPDYSCTLSILKRNLDSLKTQAEESIKELEKCKNYSKFKRHMQTTYHSKQLKHIKEQIAFVEAYMLHLKPKK